MHACSGRRSGSICGRWWGASFGGRPRNLCKPFNWHIASSSFSLSHNTITTTIEPGPCRGGDWQDAGALGEFRCLHRQPSKLTTSAHPEGHVAQRQKHHSLIRVASCGVGATSQPRLASSVLLALADGFQPAQLHLQVGCSQIHSEVLLVARPVSSAAALGGHCSGVASMVEVDPVCWLRNPARREPMKQ